MAGRYSRIRESPFCPLPGPPVADKGEGEPEDLDALDLSAELLARLKG